MNIQRDMKQFYNECVFKFAQNFLSGFLFGRLLNINDSNKNMKTKQTIVMGPLM